MIVIKITTTGGETVNITEQELHRTIIAYLRKHSPDRVKIIAEAGSENGTPKNIPAAVMFIAKNPAIITYYTDVVKPLKTEEL